MEALKLVSGYAKMVSPFLAAILSPWEAYDLRHKLWHCHAGAVVTAIFIAYGLAKVLA